jgi:hypothetical protein
MEALVQLKQKFEKTKQLLKKMKYWRTYASIHTCLKKFRSCVKVVLILWMTSADGFVLCKIFPFFSAIYAFCVKCYDFLKGAIEWVVDLFLEIY